MITHTWCHCWSLMVFRIVHLATSHDYVAKIVPLNKKKMEFRICAEHKFATKNAISSLKSLTFKEKYISAKTLIVLEDACLCILCPYVLPHITSHLVVYINVIFHNLNDTLLSTIIQLYIRHYDRNQRAKPSASIWIIALQ